MSGYALVDYDADLWIEIPPCWGLETWPDHRTWARGRAEMCWMEREDGPHEYEVDNLALALAMCAEILGPDAEEQAEDPWDGYLYLPHPRDEILAVRVFVIRGDEAAEGELAEWAGQSSPALRPVEIRPISNPALGSGIRGIRYYEGYDGGEEIGLRYVFRVSPSILVMVMAASKTIPPLEKALPAFDEFARAVKWMEVPTEA